MVNQNLRAILIQIAKEYPEDKIAKLLAYFYPKIKNLDRNNLFEFLHSKIAEINEIDLSEIQITEGEISLEDFENKDYRIKAIEISSLRGIPDLDDNNVPFGIDFTEDKQVNNAIILANNGVGKSSLFAGMEMVFAQEIGEKQLRSSSDIVPTQAYNDYLKRFGSTKKPYCKIQTIDHIGTLENPLFNTEQLIKTFNPSNHFISDYDILSYGKINFSGDSNDKSSFHSIVANSLGLSEFIQFQDVVSSIPSYHRLKESKRYNELINEKKDKEKTVINIKELLGRNKEEIKTFGENKAQDSSVSERIEKVSQSLNRLLFDKTTWAEIKDIIAAFKKEYNKLLGSEKNTKAGIEQDFLDASQHLLHDAIDCPLCQNSNSSIEEIRLLVEKRLAILKAFESEEKKLKDTFKTLFDSLNRFLYDFKSIIEYIAIEKELIRSDSGLSVLLDIEETFYMRFAPMLIDSEMFEFVDDMSKKFSIGFEEFESAHSFIDGPIIRDIGLVINETNRLIDARVKFSIEWKENNSQSGSQIEKKVQLEQEIIRLEAQLKEIENRLKTIELEIEIAKELADRVNQVKKEVDDFYPKLESTISEIVLKSFDPVQEIVESVMRDYLHESHLDLSINIENQAIPGEDITKQVIVAQIINKSTGQVITPDMYFNTFRYKLFALMISLSLALATRQKYKINLPLVMDDLFSGSDFVSKNSFSEFLIKVIQLFHKYTPELPLQFILFTHDDVIIRSAMDAIFDPQASNESLEYNDYDLLTRTTKVGRIFKPNDKENTPRKLIEGEQYWNLLFELPKTLTI